MTASGVGRRASGVNHEGRGRLTRGALLLAAGVLLAVGTLHGQFPEPRGAINDFADLLTDAEERTLSDLAEAVDGETTAEIAVATVTSLDGMSVEEYANRLFAQWGIGQADKDNGVLILVAPNEREMRIEVGYGLEEVLPDGLAGQIIRESFTPAFRDGEYARGILDGTSRVAAIVRRNQPLTADQIAALDRAATTESDVPIEWLLVPFFGLFVAIGGGFGGAGIGSRTLGLVFFALVFAGIPMAMALLIVSRTGVWILVALGVVAFIVGVLIGRNPKYRAELRGSRGTSKRGWVWGQGGSGGSGGGSSGWSGGGSSGGFSGGSSGGGGASGRW